MSLPRTAVPPLPDDPLVASAMRAAAAVPSGDCPDAEVLGLYAERALDDDAERVAVDAHVVGCARCQAIVADLVRALPELADGQGGAAPASVVGWLSGWRWLLPVASVAAAAGVAVWLGRPPETPGLVAEHRSTAGAEALEHSLRQSAAENAVVPADSARAELPAPLRDAPPRSLPERQRGAGDPDTSGRLDNAAMPAPFEVDALREQSLDLAKARESVGATAEAPAPPPTAVPATPAANLASADSFRAKEELGRRAEKAGASALRAAADPPRWRVLDGRVERSTDREASWVRVELPTTEMMVTVAVRNDGTVVATSSTGRTWTSTDGGTTWTADPQPAPSA